MRLPMNQNRRPRLTGIGALRRAAVSTRLRARLIVMLVLVTVVTAAAFTSTGYAKRVSSLVGTRLSKQSPARTTNAQGQKSAGALTARADDGTQAHVVSPKPTETRLV